jgi:exonuclease SbcD
MRMVIEYPADWEPLINETELRRRAECCFEFHLVRRPQREARLRLPADHAIASLTPLDLLDVYWRSMNASEEEAQALRQMAQQLMSQKGE